MSLKRSFIQMSITKQINILWVVWDGGVDMHERIYINFCTSLILTNILNQSVNNELEHIDNNMMNIYAQFADVTGVLFLDLGKYDIALLRRFYQNLIEEAKDETDVGFFKQINPIESHFVEGSVLDNNKCDSSKDCFAYVGTISESKAKILELLAPILKVSMKTKPYHQLADELFQEIYFYFNDEKLFASFPYMIERVKNYQPLVTAFKSNPEYFSNLSQSMANKYKTEIIDTITLTFLLVFTMTCFSIQQQ